MSYLILHQMKGYFDNTSSTKKTNSPTLLLFKRIIKRQKI